MKPERQEPRKTHTQKILYANSLLHHLRELLKGGKEGGKIKSDRKAASSTVAKTLSSCESLVELSCEVKERGYRSFSAIHIYPHTRAGDTPLSFLDRESCIITAVWGQ